MATAQCQDQPVNQLLQNQSNNNTVVYKLFPQLPSSSSGKDLSDALEQYLHETLAKLAPYLTSYIWHYEPFTLRKVLESSDGPHLEGSLNFEDNIEDEWFVVWLLFTLTHLDQNLVATVEDEDGQFLLIEAAEELPKHITPENSDNRVYIYHEKLHFIPLKEGPFRKGTVPDLVDGVSLIRSQKFNTALKDGVQKVISQRIREFPGKIKQLQHRARCYLPIKVAALLQEDPSLISFATRAFYLRDPIDLKACRLMKNFPPASRVWSQVTFTRCQFAQLTCQKFMPDRKLNWNIPPANSPLFKGYDLGMKLACGFEILVNNASKDKSGAEPWDESESKWASFKASLSKNGYFEGLVENSKQYKNKLDEAKRYYAISIADQTLSNHNEALNYDKIVGKKVADKIEKLELHEEDFSSDINSLEPDDDDSWLTLHFDEFEEMLNEKFLSSKTKSKDFAKEFPKSLQQFLEHESGLDGVEAPQNRAKNNGPQSQFLPGRLDAKDMEEAMKSIMSWKLPKRADHDSSSSCGMTDSDDGKDSELDSDDDDILMMDTSSEEVATKRKDKTKKNSEAQSFMVEMKKYMKQMDRELEGTKVLSKVGSRPPPLAQFDDETDLNDDSDLQVENRGEGVDSMEDFNPVNVDLSALKNLVDCYESGEGPARNLFNAMGVIPSQAGSSK